LISASTSVRLAHADSIAIVLGTPPLASITNVLALVVLQSWAGSHVHVACDGGLRGISASPVALEQVFAAPNPQAWKPLVLASLPWCAPYGAGRVDRFLNQHHNHALADRAEGIAV
jgi:hypothetical protein